MKEIGGETMIKRAVAVGVFWTLITIAVVYIMLLGLGDGGGISIEAAMVIFVVFIMFPVQIGCMAYLTVLIESVRPQVKK
jgi:hypothetical protein